MGDNTIELDSIEVEKNAAIVDEVRRLIVVYRSIFREPPAGIAISPVNWLQLGVSLLRSQRIGSYDSGNEIKIDGVPISVKLNGPPEVLARVDDAKYIYWMLQKNDKRLWSMMTGS